MNAKRILLGLGCVLTAFTAVADSDPLSGLYACKATLPETMLATRARHAAWLTTQQPARAAVTPGPWFVAEDNVGAPDPGVDLAAKDKSGKALWSQRLDWKDGTVIPAGGDNPTQKSVLVCRDLTTKQAVTLTVGLGGGDRMGVWLNGKQVASLDTHLDYKRYGTGMRLEGDRRNQFLLNLPLTAGTNWLMVSVRQERVVPHRELCQFYFSPAPDPVPRFWEQLRRDFPPATSRLLETVRFNWFERGGWFDSPSNAHLEREFLTALVASLEGTGGPVKRELDTLIRANAPATDPRWLNLCMQAADLSVAVRDIARLRQAVGELGRSFPGKYPAADCARRLDDLERRLDLASAAAALSELDRHRRAMLVEANPLLKGRKLLFARRHTYDSQHYYDDYYHGPTAWGGNLTELDPATGRTRDLVPQLEGGIFDRYDLSHDAKRVVFGYRARKPEGYRIWEQRLDENGLRQITLPPPDEAERVARHSGYSPAALKEDPRLYGHWTDDMHPCYLPDGRIVFVSSRSERTVLCGTHALTCTTLYRMDVDGGNLHPISQGALTESTPTMLDDGRILYTRWEYVYKGIAAVQSLWAVRPDGTGSEEVYGHNIDNPGVFFAGRQIPGRPDWIVATGCGHEPLAVGSIRLIDRAKDRRTKAAMTSLTPEVETRGLRGLYQFRNGQWREDVRGPFYCDPYPLSDRFFLVSCNPDQRYNDPKGYGIYLIDAFGNRVELHRDPAMSCFQPMVVAPRPVEPTLPLMTVQSDRSTGEPEATVLLVDLYRNLPGVAPGTVKHLRVMEQIPRSWVASQIHPGDTVPGQAPAISLHTHIWVAVLLGVVPVEEDGSACFKVPARRNIFFQALDKDFMEVQKMRTFVNFQPGETRSCVGCHDPRNGTPPPAQPLAMLRPPRAIVPQPGDTGPQPIHYPADVQPILDRHCVSCHGGARTDGNLDLSGTLTEHFSISYESVLRKGLVNFIQEWTGPAPGKGGPAYASNGSMLHSEAVPPYTYGSHRSRLVDVVRKGHEKVALSREEFIRLVTWVDANAPFYGSYFGRRNIAAKNRPDFRVAPTLATARGVPPEPACANPIPAELLAWWTLQERAGQRVNDASGHGHDAQVAGTPPHFDGRSFLQGGQLGAQEAISVALWVRPDALGNRWNPLLFTDGGGLSAFHFSILDDGTPNVAINTGDKHWVHNRANTSLATGRWRHVTVVCDSRFGGRIGFYVDGKPAGAGLLDLGIPLDLSAFRIGAWSNWANTPNNNFHGGIRDIRIYRGTLDGAEIARLARTPPQMTRR